MLREYSADGPNSFENLMNVLHLPHGYWPAAGGAEYLTRAWSEGLASRGHTVQVSVADLMTPEGLYRFGIAPTGRSDEVLNGVSVGRLELDATYRLGTVMFRRDPYAPKRTGDHLRRRIRASLKRDLRREIERFQPDIVLTLPHLFENVRIVFELHRDLGFPLVWGPLLHESDPNWSFAEVSEHVKIADAVIAMTPWEADRLVTRYGADAERVHVVPPGVPVPDSPPDAAADGPTVLYLGRLSRSKGLDVLAAAMGIVWGQQPKTRLIVAGAATPDVPEIHDMLRKVSGSVQGALEFHTDIAEYEKQRLLSTSTVLVLPSDRESFGIVLLEAWAAAMPVITLDSPVFRDTVSDGVDGIRVRDRSSQCFAEAILELVGDQDKSRKMGIAGFTRVRTEYSTDRVSSLLERVYNETINRPLQNSA